jgi:2-polyprenyl-3-methyl-5-hydroxy-6-metoxy-1,4-benzoquinol methylase
MVSPLHPDDPDFDISSDVDVRALHRAEEQHFWHRARNRFIVGRLRALAGRRAVLDLGCGGGSVTAALARAGYDVTGLDGHPALLEVASRRAPAVKFVCHDLRTGPPSLPGAPYDVVSLFDVIEHVDEPSRLLETAAALAKPGGLVVGTVPSLMLLWSGIDEHSGHKTRYGRAALRAVLERVSGTAVLEVVPFFRALVPLMLVQRRIVGRRGDAAGAAENLRVPPRPLNWGLDMLLRAEELLAPALEPFGIPGASLWFAMRKA